MLFGFYNDFAVVALTSTPGVTSCPDFACSENEECVISVQDGATSVKCVCIAGYKKEDDKNHCVPEIPAINNAAPVDITVSLGGNKELQYPKNRTNIQSTIIPEHSIDDSDPYMYTWTILTKPENDKAAFDHKLGSAIFSNLSPGLYTVQLEVSRGKGTITGSDVINITVNGKPKKNSPPVAIVKPNPVKVSWSTTKLSNSFL